MFERTKKYNNYAYLVSTSRITLQRRAQAALIIVDWAPESTNAFTGVPFTVQLIYLQKKMYS